MADAGRLAILITLVLEVLDGATPQANTFALMTKIIATRKLSASLDASKNELE
jgi:hypothetical protein